MKVYLAGYINGNKIEECLAWRHQIVQAYRSQSYPIVFLDPLNGKDLESITKDGLKSNLSPGMIFSGDYMSVNACDVLVANMDKFGEQRDSVGTTCEVTMAYMLRKSVVMITKDPQYRDHPFFVKMVDRFVESVDELLDEKILNTYYKRINDALY